MQNKYPCPVCGTKCLSEPSGSFDICPVCGWEDDYAGQRNPDGRCAHPKYTLNQARSIWKSGQPIFQDHPHP